MIANEISSVLHIPILVDALTKIKKTPELKSVYDYEARIALLKDAFSVNADLIKGKNVLLFDDLYRSGATLSAITTVLYGIGNAKIVYVLTLTRTRSIQ